jgi:ERF superfamily
MGAALTYARRYALFTLVGIAGEDDLDAPDLNANVDAVSDLARGVAAHTQSARARDERPPAPASFLRREKAARPARTILGPDASVKLRDRLLADLSQLVSADEAADWVNKNLPAKNTLIANDADLVEAGFRERLATIEAACAGPDMRPMATAESVSDPNGTPFIASMEDPPAALIVFPGAGARGRCVAAKTIRLRDREHCKFVATQPCVVCGRAPTEAHHIRFAQPRAFGRKVSDEYTVPVCRLHHRDLHGYGDEASWWAGVSIDPLPIALELWRRSRMAQIAEGS